MSQVVLLTSGPKELGTAKKAPFTGWYRTIGAYKIAHQCRKNGYTAQVIDHVGYLSEQELIQLLDKFVTNDTLILGLSTTFAVEWPYREMSLMLAKCLAYIKNKFPNLKLVYGGYGLECIKSPRTPEPWAIIVEYGEDIFIEILNHLARGAESPRYKLIFSGNGNTIRSYQSSRDRYNIVNDDFRWHPSDNILPGEVLPIEISRGCIFKCKFCNHLLLGRGKLDYLRDMQQIRDEMIYNYENWGTTRYYIICDTFNDTEVKMQAWHSMVTSLPFKIEYTAYLRADLLHRFPDVPYMLKESGLIACFNGIESFGPGALAVGKGWSHKSGREYLPELYNNIWKKEVHHSMSFIVGLPGDTKQTAIDTVAWFIDNKMCNILFHVLGLHNPNTRSSTNYSEFDLNAVDYGYTFPFNNDQWHHPDWGTQRETSHFLQKQVLPLLENHNASLSSWVIMQALQLGVTDWKTTNIVQLENARKHQMDQYLAKLMRS
jgi:hypothetical protein